MREMNIRTMIVQDEYQSGIKGCKNRGGHDSALGVREGFVKG